MGFVASLCPEGALSIAATAATSARATSFSGASTYTRSQSISAPVPAAPPSASLVNSTPSSNILPSRTPSVAPSPPMPSAEASSRPTTNRLSTTMSFEQTYNSLLRASPAPTTNLRSGTASVYLPEESEFFGSAITPSPPPSSVAYSELGHGNPPAVKAFAAGSAGGASGQKYPSAQEEKAQAFSQAKAAVARTQNGLPPDHPEPPPLGSSSSSTEPATASSNTPAFESAAAEKKRLFEQLQNKTSTSKDASSSQAVSGGSGAHTVAVGASVERAAAPVQATASEPAFETAAQEKARLFREAQGRASSAQATPSLAHAPGGPSSAVVPPSSGPVIVTRLPAFESAAAEKARLFREAQGRAAGSSSSSNAAPVVRAPADSGRSPASAAAPAQESATEEKARLRRQFEAAQAAVASRHGQLHPSAPPASYSDAFPPNVAPTAPLSISKATISARDQPPGETVPQAQLAICNDAPSNPLLEDLVPYDAIDGGQPSVAQAQPASSKVAGAAERALTEKVHRPCRGLRCRSLALTLTTCCNVCRSNKNATTTPKRPSLGLHSALAVAAPLRPAQRRYRPSCPLPSRRLRGLPTRSTSSRNDNRAQPMGRQASPTRLRRAGQPRPRPDRLSIARIRRRLTSVIPRSSEGSSARPGQSRSILPRACLERLRRLQLPRLVHVHRHHHLHHRRRHHRHLSGRRPTIRRATLDTHRLRSESPLHPTVSPRQATGPPSRCPTFSHRHRRRG